MDKSFSFINNIFKRLFDSNTPYDNIINIINSDHVNLSGNVFNPNYYIFDGFADSDHKDNIVPIKDLNYQESIVETATKRAEMNNDYMERFIYYCNRQGITPTIRCYAFFSHLSSIRKRSDMNDYNQLILSERDLFYKMLDLKYHFKLIISLDIPTILSKWYANIDSAINRITDLIDNIDEICANNNIQVVIDENNSMDGQFILHNSLYIHALNADVVKKYNITKYETEKDAINNAITNFDRRFRYLSFSNQQVKKHLQTTSMSIFLKHTLDARLEEWYHHLDNAKTNE